MSFQDIFKKSFLEGFTSTDINIYTAVVAMSITAFLSVYIFFVYRVLTKKTFYSKSFNISIAGIAIITSSIILTIQSSIVVSLGMVGALSIIRFRTAIKDPMDLMFLFWSIAVGIICGVGLGEIAILLSLILTIGIMLLNSLPVARAPMILVINVAAADAEPQIVNIIKGYAKHFTVKSRSVTKGRMDLVIELRTDKGDKLVESISQISTIISVSLMKHDGEVTF